MKKVNISELAPGMVLAEDVYDLNQQVNPCWTSTPNIH